MKRIIKLLPIVAVICMGVLSCDKDDKDDDKSPSVVPAIQPNGDYAVDLGLSVKWATCNVGATTPEEYGDYFAWGDTITFYESGYAQEHPQSHWKEGKTGYDWSNYKYCNGTYNTMTKYCTKSDYGSIDTDTILFAVDDVAHYKWGGNWRMPTRAEFKALLDSCNCEFITQNGVKGLKVTSRKDSSQSIFLPAAGCRSSNSLYNVDYYGLYWSGTLDTADPYRAWDICFGSGGHNMHRSDRYYGQSVRPVCP